MSMNFTLNKEQIREVMIFHPECKGIYTGREHGEEYIFMPTLTGMRVKYRCKCGVILELTEEES